MSLKIKSVSVNTQSIFSQLIFELEIPFRKKFDYPIQTSGILSTFNDFKEIASLVEYKHYNRDILINSMDNHTLYEYTSKNQDNSVIIRLVADLSPKAIEHIENLREKKTPKDVEFRLELQVKYIHSDYNCEKHKFLISQNNIDCMRINEKKGSQDKIEHLYDTSFIKYTFESMQIDCKIEQSNWITTFAEKLSIGKFLLLELNVPEITEINGRNSIEFYKSFITIINQLDDYIKKGEWKAAMIPLRQFFENFKNVDFQNEIVDLLNNDGHNEEGIKNFFTGTNSFFHFIAKHIHILDQKNNSKTIPLASKEEVYLGYSLAIAILNLISKKYAKKLK